MPVVGEFHGRFWRTRANIPPPPGAGVGWMYPQTQSVVTLHSVVFGVPLDAVGRLWRRICAVARITRHVWSWSEAQHAAFWASRTPGARVIVAVPAAPVTDEHAAILARTQAVFAAPWWALARQEVRACATSPKFHQPDQWVAYSRAVKANPGHAQNVWRHVKVVLALQAAFPEIGNPAAHLAAELAYQEFAAEGRPDRRIVDHPRVA